MLNIHIYLFRLEVHLFEEVTSIRCRRPCWSCFAGKSTMPKFYEDFAPDSGSIAQEKK
jgi:hypothetical protein